jgi:hypothetical protein
VIIEELLGLLYTDKLTKEQKLAPFYLLMEDSVNEWPTVSVLCKHETFHENKQTYSTERVIEELETDHSANPAYLMLVLVESLITVSTQTRSFSFPLTFSPKLYYVLLVKKRRKWSCGNS